MKNRGLLLLRTLLLSTSQINIYKHTTDKKKKRRITAGFVGMVCLYAMIMGYSIAMCVGYGQYGIIDAAPVMCALTVSALAFVFTLLKTNGYLFNFREYDMLMSLPFGTSTVAGCKFLYMYVKSLPWYLSISLAMMIGYGKYARPSIAVYPVWIILTFFIPVIPMLAAAFLGFLIARVSSGFKKTNIAQTVLTMIFIIFCFSLRFIIDYLFADNKVQSTLEQISDLTDRVSKVYLPAGWFASAVTRLDIPGMLLLTAVSAALFMALFYVVGRSYRNINSAMRSHAAARNFRMSAQKKHSVVRAIAFKEFRRLTGSTAYMANVALGEVLAVIMGLIALIFGFDKLLSLVIHGVEFDHSILQPAIPFIVYFFIGMLATTACSPSLEGKNYWIVQSLPIDKKTLYQGKMLFNMCLTVPFMAFSTLCLCISAKVPAAETVLYLVLGLALCAFSTAWGCVCGIKHMRLDWENEIEVIKQGAAVSIYLLPNMFVVMGLAVLVVILGMRMDHILLISIFITAAAVLAVLSYLRVMSLTAKMRI